MFGFIQNPIDRIIKAAVERVYQDTNNTVAKNLGLLEDITRLREELESLRIEKGRKEEEYVREKREVTHKLGLDRMRQEQEAANHKTEIELKIREGNLASSEERFKQQMDFQREQLQSQINGLQTLVEKVFEKIPDVKHEMITTKQLTGKEV